MNISISEKAPVVVDKLKRSFRTVRLSLTSSCNMACNYCVDENYLAKKDAGLPYQSYLKIIESIQTLCNIHTVRLTGGEPLLYNQLPQLIEALKKRDIERICLTTNASLLKSKLGSLLNAGLDSMNISLDAVEKKPFFEMSRRKNLEQVLDATRAAANSSLDIKLNSTIVYGKNHQQVLPLLEFARSLNIKIRYLELMNMGYLHKKNDLVIFSEKEILNEIKTKFDFTKLERKPSATANYFRLSDGYEFGIIANESTPFCHDCDRLRIDSQGKIYGCLSSNKAFTTESILDNTEEMKKVLQQALAEKQTVKFQGSDVAMIEIGG